MPQAKSDKKDAFAKRVGQLRTYAKEKGVFKSEAALAAFIGISRAMLYAYLDGTQEVSDKTLGKLSDAEARIGLVPYEKISGNNLMRFGKDRDSSLKLNPAFAQPAADPSAQDCLEHLKAFLSEAQHVPGLIGHTLIELRERFPVEKALRLRQQHEESL